jgi:hypothetical protein
MRPLGTPQTTRTDKWIDSLIQKAKTPKDDMLRGKELREVMNQLPKKAQAIFDAFEKTAAEQAKTEFGNSATVYRYLKTNYPASTLKWVDGASWTRKKVALADIQMARRPGGAREQEKVKRITEAFNKGEKMEPVVLVKLPDGRIKIADGYHRTLGGSKSGKPTIDAWVGVVEENNGPWDKEMHEKKLNITKAAMEQGEFEKEAFMPLVAGAAKLGGKIIKGAGKEIKNASKGITGSGVRKAKSNLADVKVAPNSTKDMIRDAKKTVRGEQFNRVKTFGLAGIAGAGVGLNQLAKIPTEPVQPDQFDTFK